MPLRCILSFLIIAIACQAGAQSLYFPPTAGDTWETMDPAELNWCPERIDSMYQFLDDEETNAFMVLKDGKIVLEKYYDPYHADSVGPWFSAGKCLMATLIGIAQEEGLLTINDKTSEYLGSGWTSLSPEREDSITIWHQLTMTTGLDEADFTCTDSNCLIYKAPAGSRWVYHNAPYSLLRDVLEDATGFFINFYNNTRIANKIGMSGFWFPVGYNNFYLSDARSMARFGLLIQAQGQWDGTTVLGDTAYINQMTRKSQDLNESYGYLWWINGENTRIEPASPQVLTGELSPHAPEDVFVAAGSEGQFISISPSEGLIMIRQGASSSPDLAAIDLHDQIWEHLIDLNCATGIEQNERRSMSVYPNPTDGMLYLKGLKRAPEVVELVDHLGRTLPLTPALQLDVSEIKAGSYILRVESGEFAYFSSVIIQ